MVRTFKESVPAVKLPSEQAWQRVVQISPPWWGTWDSKGALQVCSSADNLLGRKHCLQTARWSRHLPEETLQVQHRHLASNCRGSCPWRIWQNFLEGGSMRRYFGNRSHPRGNNYKHSGRIIKNCFVIIFMSFAYLKIGPGLRHERCSARRYHDLRTEGACRIHSLWKINKSATDIQLMAVCHVI